MTKIKICGIKNVKEAEILNKLHPDYAGFVFAQSKRQISQEKAAKIISNLEPSIKKAGVFVDMPVEEAAGIAKFLGLDVLQLHGDEDRQYIELLRSLIKPGTEIWKAFRIDEFHMPDIEEIRSLKADRLLLDTFSEGAKGGTGRCFDWRLATLIQKVNLPIVLAGGLNPDNVKEALKQASPYAVDTSSGVETLGEKDEEKVAAFMAAVKGG